MRLPEDDPICGPKHVAAIKYNQSEQVRWFISIFIFIAVLTAKYDQELSKLKALHKRKLCRKSRTNEQSFVSLLVF
jgi:hypothetical protein